MSATAGLCYFAQLMRQRSGEYLRSDVKRRAGAMFDALSQQGVSFNTVVDVSAIDSAPGIPTGWGTTNTAKWLLWEDPLLHHLSAQVRINEVKGDCRAIGCNDEGYGEERCCMARYHTLQHVTRGYTTPTSVSLSTHTAFSQRRSPVLGHRWQRKTWRCGTSSLRTVWRCR